MTPGSQTGVTLCPLVTFQGIIRSEESFLEINAELQKSSFKIVVQGRFKCELFYLNITEKLQPYSRMIFGMPIGRTVGLI